MLLVICNGCKVKIDPEKKGIDNIADLLKLGWLSDSNFRHVCPTCVGSYEATKDIMQAIHEHKQQKLETKISEPVFEPVETPTKKKGKTKPSFPVYICRYSSENNPKKRGRKCKTYTFNTKGLDDVKNHELVSHPNLYIELWGKERQPTSFRCKKKEVG